MSFLSRRSSRAGKRDDRSASDAGRRHEDREYGGYEYEQDDDNWSPDEYFSPEGIKGRWASGRHSGPPAGRRDPDPREIGRREAGRGYDGYDAGPQAGRGPRTPAGYGRDSYPEPYQPEPYQQANGYDAEDETGGRGAGRKRRGNNAERADRPERRRRLGRRDRDDDIWPDDGVSDEDYWASVAADRPLPSVAPSQEADATQMMGAQASAAPGRPAPAGYPGNESRTGRLGPPPGLSSGPYPPVRNSGPMARPGTTPGTGVPGAGVPGAGRPAAGHTQPGFQPSDGRFDSTERFDRIDRPREPAAYADPRRGQDRRPPEHRPPEHRPPEHRPAEHRPPEHRAGGRHSAGWAGADDDPLTSKAYSREAMAEADARSYRAAAARRPQVPADRYEAALGEQTQTFTMNGQYPSDPQGYPVRGQQPQQPQRPQAPQHGAPGSRATGDRDPSYPYPEQQPYPPRQTPDRDEDPHGRPGAGRHAGNGYGGQGNARRGNGRY